MADYDATFDLSQVTQRLAQLPDKAYEAVAKALYEEAIAIMAKSQPLCPVDTGLLRSTGTVETENSPGPEAVVTLSYGGKGQAPYAVYVHERTDLHHPVGQHHFLSAPFYEATAGMTERLAQTIRTALGG
jgi:hypothetical protein